MIGRRAYAGGPSFFITFICVNSLVVGLPPCTFIGDYTNEHE